MKQDPTTTSASSQTDGIHTAAYLLWQNAGCPGGQALDFWLQAERQTGTAPASPASRRQPSSKVSSATPADAAKVSSRSGQNAPQKPKRTESATAMLQAPKSRNKLSR